MKMQRGWAAALAALFMLGGCSSRSARPQTEVVEPMVTRAAVPLASVPAALQKPLALGDQIEYLVQDKYTGNRRKVLLEVTRLSADRVTFNQGARVERPDGQPLELAGVLLGDMDAMMPAGGWGNDNLSPGAYWTRRHNGNGEAGNMAYALKAEAGEPTQLNTPMGMVPVVPIEYWGWATDKTRSIATPSKVSVLVWYSPQLKRVIRMESTVKPATTLAPRTYESSRELIELTAVHRR